MVFASNCTFTFHFHFSFSFYAGMVFLLCGHLATCTYSQIALFLFSFTFHLHFRLEWFFYHAAIWQLVSLVLPPSPIAQSAGVISKPLLELFSRDILLLFSKICTIYNTCICKSSMSYISKNMTKGWKWIIVDEMNEYGYDIVYLLPQLR